MTPPINIDGTNENYSTVTIDGQDVTQITIDGQDVLTAIPDSGDIQYYMDEGSGTDLNDRFDTTDATLNGPTWSSDSTAVGDFVLDFDPANTAFWETNSELSIDSFSACVWTKLRDFTNFDNAILSAGDEINNGGDSGFIVRTEDTEGNLEVTTSDSGNAGAAISSVSFSGLNEWGFVGLTYDAPNNDLRIITFNNTQELEDTTVSPSNQPGAETVPWRGGTVSNNSAGADEDALDGQEDFAVLKPGGVLTKTEITDLYEATQR